MKIASYKPLRDLVLVRETGTISGLIIPGKTPNIMFKDKQVIAIGPDVNGIEVGDYVNIPSEAYNVTMVPFVDVPSKESVEKLIAEDLKKDAFQRSMNPDIKIPPRTYPIEAYFSVPFSQIIGICNPSSEDPKVESAHPKVVLPN